MPRCQTDGRALRLGDVFRRWLDRPPCALCGSGDTPGALLCQACHADLPWTDACAGPATGGTLESPLHAQVAALDYRFPVDAMIRRLKFQGELWLAPVLGRLLLERCGTAARPQCLMPIPLSDQRLAERGFNQSTEIARVLAAATRIPMQPRGMRRVRDTVPQSSLPLAGRAQNLRGAFVVDRPVTGMHVALVDDVTTTGATGAEAAGALLRQGAARVDLWVVARTPLDPGY
jgi:ComF family protein